MEKIMTIYEKVVQLRNKRDDRSYHVYVANMLLNEHPFTRYGWSKHMELIARIRSGETNNNNDDSSRL